MKKSPRREVIKLAGVGAAAALTPGLLAACGDDEGDTTSRSDGSVPASGGDPAGNDGAADGGRPEDGSAPPATGEPAAEELDPERPFWHQGNFRPVTEEREALELTVEGALPPELNGLFVRNGSNPQDGENAHWFVGNGMAHGIRLENGRAVWYRNRWVETPTLSTADGAGGPPTLEGNDSNVALVHHAGRLLSLGEVGLPYELSTDDLSTRGVYDFGGRLATAMTAHPKLDPVTGEMLMFGYNWAPPYLTYHLVDADGTLARSEEIEVPGATMMHNFAITESRVLFFDLPIVFDLSLASSGLPFVWSDDYGARIGVMPRDGGNADVRWFEIDPCYIFHVANAYDDGDAVVLEASRLNQLWKDGPHDFGGTPTPFRWRLDLAGDAASEEALDDIAVDFPQVDPRVVGRPYRYSYGMRYDGLGDDHAVPIAKAVVKYDMQTGERKTIELGAGLSPDERIFVPASNRAGEDEGYLLGFVYDRTRNASDLQIHDASSMDQSPIAKIELPYRVPFGFHGLWVPS